MEVPSSVCGGVCHVCQWQLGSGGASGWAGSGREHSLYSAVATAAPRSRARAAANLMYRMWVGLSAGRQAPNLCE